MHSLYADAVATMTLDDVNQFEREGVLPIAFSLIHITNMIDASFMLITGTLPIWNDEWAAQVDMAIADHGKHGKHGTVAEMGHQRIGNYAAFPMGSPCSMPSSAGSTSTAFATWVRSSWPAASSAWGA